MTDFDEYKRPSRKRQNTRMTGVFVNKMGYKRALGYGMAESRLKGFVSFIYARGFNLVLSPAIIHARIKSS